MDILIGTKNPYKAEEMISLLDGIKNLKIHYLDEITNKPTIEEDQISLKGNAEKKATAISKYTDYFVLTSDGGVDIPGLGDKWNILKNQRTVGEDKTDREKVNVLINLMRGLKGEERKCIDHFAIALAKNGQSIWSFEDIYNRDYIVEKPAKRKIPKGKWMSFVWFCPQYQKVLADLNEDEKQEVRKQANRIKVELQKCIKSL